MKRKHIDILPNFEFPKCFNVTYSANHWSNITKSIELFKQIILSYLNDVKKTLNYPQEQTSLIIIDTFKGQDNKVIMDLCKGNFCHVVIIPHNLTHKFQPLGITVNKPAKSFIANKYNAWFANEVTKQLAKGIKPADVKVSLGL